MVRAFKLSLAAIAVLAAGSSALLAMAPGAAAQPAAAPSSGEAAPIASQPSAPAAPTAAPVVSAPPPAAAPAPQPARDDFKSWSSEAAKLPQDLGRMGPSLKLGLDQARNDDMAFCFRDLEDGGRGSRATDFVLYLEARDGAVDVVEAKVARPGALPASVIECARDVLRGLEVKVYFAEPGRRFSYVYEVEA
jgi:hypothetical protein